MSLCNIDMHQLGGANGAENMAYPTFFCCGIYTMLQINPVPETGVSRLDGNPSYSGVSKVSLDELN